MTMVHPATQHVPRTKLHPPRLPADVIDRPRLLARLDRARDAKLTLLWAPAGYGKSTLLASWRAAGERPMAWLSLDEHDDTVSAFVHALVAAIQAVLPGWGKDTLALLNLPEPCSPALFASILTDELGSLSEPLALVIDNYDQMLSPLVHDLLSTILEQLPARARIVVSSRTLPPLPLPTLRAEGQLVDLGVDELRFGTSETREFLDRSLGERLAERTVTFLAERTEGWPAGLRLAAVLLRDRPDRDAVLTALATGSHAFIRDFLLDEILAEQPPDARRFLLATSILDRFRDRLCSAVVDDLSPSESGEMLRRLMHDGIMLVGLDEDGEWFRYHHLFLELLRRRLHDEVDPDTVAALHRRAAAWLAAEGAVIPAVRHLLAAGDADAAARLVEADVHPALNREDWAQVADELAALPASQTERRPVLLLARAWVLHFHGQVPAMVPLLEQVELALASRSSDDDADASLQGELDTLWGGVWLQRGDLRASLAHAQRGGEHLADDKLYARGVAAGLLGVALHRRGHGRDALRMYRTRAERETGSTAVYTARLLLIMSYCYLADARLDLLENQAWRILSLARDHRLPVTSTWIQHALGRVLYEWNEPERAAEQYAAVVERRDEAHFYAYRDSVFGLALCYQAMGQPGRAQDEVKRLLRMMREAGRGRQLGVIQSFEARLALLRGDPETWGRWLDTNRETFTADPPTAFTGLESPPLTRAWALIVLGDAASVAQANEELKLLQARFAAENDRSRLVHVLALQGLARYSRGDQASGLGTLERALAIGRRGGFVRTFVDLGPGMARMVSALTARDRPSGYLRRLHAAFSATGPVAPRGAPAAGPQDDEPVEPLTWREQDVLKQLSHRLSNKEIASALDISPLTVKKHAESIYRKLHVNGRRDAITRAQALGLI